MPEEEKEQAPDVTIDESPDGPELSANLEDGTVTRIPGDIPTGPDKPDLEPKDHSDRGFGGIKETAPPTLAPEVEAAFRKIAKEEIGKALGHTVV